MSTSCNRSYTAASASREVKAFYAMVAPTNEYFELRQLLACETGGIDPIPASVPSEALSSNKGPLCPIIFMWIHMVSRGFEVGVSDQRDAMGIVGVQQCRRWIEAVVTDGEARGKLSDAGRIRRRRNVGEGCGKRD